MKMATDHLAGLTPAKFGRSIFNNWHIIRVHLGFGNCLHSSWSLLIAKVCVREKETGKERDSRLWSYMGMI